MFLHQDGFATPQGGLGPPKTVWNPPRRFCYPPGRFGELPGRSGGPSGRSGKHDGTGKSPFLQDNTSLLFAEGCTLINTLASQQKFGGAPDGFIGKGGVEQCFTRRKCWGMKSRHLGSLTAANWVSFDFNVSYSSC